jgi:hypothetical protein
MWEPCQSRAGKTEQVKIGSETSLASIGDTKTWSIATRLLGPSFWRLSVRRGQITVTKWKVLTMFHESAL